MHGFAHEGGDAGWVEDEFAVEGVDIAEEVEFDEVECGLFGEFAF